MPSKESSPLSFAHYAPCSASVYRRATDMIFYASFTLLTLVLAFVDARGPFYTVEGAFLGTMLYERSIDTPIVLSSDPSIELRGKWDPLAPLGGGHARYLSTSVLDASAITSLPLGGVCRCFLIIVQAYSRHSARSRTFVSSRRGRRQR